MFEWLVVQRVTFYVEDHSLDCYFASLKIKYFSLKRRDKIYHLTYIQNYSQSLKMNQCLHLYPFKTDLILLIVVLITEAGPFIYFPSAWIRVKKL